MSQNGVELAPKRPKKRISEEDVRMMAGLVAKRIDEKGACLMLGIKPQSWYNWKTHAKNNSRFAESLTHVREAKLNACIEAIDEAGDGNADKGQRPDWRAKAWLAERVLAPERYQQKAAEPTPPQPILAIVSSSIASSIFAQLGQQSPVKAICDARDGIVDVESKPVEPSNG